MSDACQHFLDGLCTHAEAIKVYGERPSPGVHRVCPHNTSGQWPTISAQTRQPLDPAALANYRRSTGGCTGCGDSPMEGM